MKKRNRLIILITTLFLFILAGVSIYAITTYTSTRGSIEVTSTALNVNTSYTSAETFSSWEYNKAGDKKDIKVEVTNNSSVNIHRYYTVELTTAEINAELASAILVYYNNEFVGTLSQLNSLNNYINDEYAILMNGKKVTDTISFELHQAAAKGLFNKKSIEIKVTTYSENADYEKYVVVSTEDEFAKALEDLSSGLLDTTPTIILANSLVLSKNYVINEPTIIQTNGFNLTGGLTIDDDEATPDALLTVLGTGNVVAAVGANYDKESARSLVVEYAKNALKYGIRSATESIDIIGPYSFYNVSVSVGNLTYVSYTSPNLTSNNNLTYTKTEELTFSSNGKSTKIQYKIIGTKTDLNEQNILNHMPEADEIISWDLFLPTAIPSCNGTIEWKSSNTGVLSNSGQIITDSNDRVAITLIATIKINKYVTTKEYTFYITSNSNQVNFQKLVSDISPLIIKTKYSEVEAEKTTYRLPIVTSPSGNTFGQWDYRTSYTSPSEDATVSWTAHQNINLTSLTYEKILDGGVDTYDYINVTGNAVTLTKDTLSNYAKIKITGVFDNGEKYESVVNISIALGSDTELLEKAFTNIDNALDNVSVLGNILNTRLADGMINEKGDFYLPATYGDSYTIEYEIADLSGIIKLGTLIDSEYKFIVDPTKFNSVETSVPIRAKVIYKKTDGTTINQTKIIYVNTPAAVHKKELGNISIFNSLKYQVISALPAAEKNNNNNEFKVDNSISTFTGYDYILLRDIVGDTTYLADYALNDLYLTIYNSTPTASGVTSITLNNTDTNNSNTTDTLAYDFTMLIQWATGNTQVQAKSVLSDTGKSKLSEALLNYKSNGETYLTENELAVVKKFYVACTNDTSEVNWNAISSEALETAPGRIYDNTTLLTTILKCLTNEKGTGSGWYENNSSVKYSTIYAKYLEVINRYATTTSENEEPMSPAQEVYNSKFYYSFTPEFNSAANSAANASFPCKYYNADGILVAGYCNRFSETNWKDGGSGTRQGTYAAGDKTGDATVDLYANATGYPYDSDRTKYITSAELMVLKAFWLGSLGNKTANASGNVLKEFNNESKALINEALAGDGIAPYPNYSASDFTYYGQAILNALDACLVTPTTFTSNGIGLLINSFYDHFDGTGYKIKDYSSTSDSSSFTSAMVDGVPAVTNLDNIEGALSYFANLATVDIKGNNSLSLFLSDYGLSTAFARITLTNSKVSSLTMQYVSPEWNTFSLTNIKHLNNLTTIDVSNNLGIKTLNPLLNTNRGKYTSINITNIGEVYEYNEFAIDNLASSTCSVTYTAKDSTTETKNSGNGSLLVNLSDIEGLVSEHLYLTNVIYNDDGSTSDVCWRVEEGNDIFGEEISQGGALDVIESLRDMNLRISPYFYCETTFTYPGVGFEAGCVYELTVNDNFLNFKKVNVDGNGNTYSVELVNEIPSTDLTDSSGIEVNIKNDSEFNKTSTSTDKSDIIYSQDVSITGGEESYSIYMYYQTFKFNAYSEEDRISNDYYLRANDTELTATKAAVADDCYMVILTKNQADFIYYLSRNANTISNVQMEKFSIEVDTANNIYLGVPELDKTTSDCYIYNMKTKKFMCSSGFTSDLGDVFTITKTTQDSWYIKNNTVNKYLDGFKVLVRASSTINIISAVFNKSVFGQDDLTNNRTESAKLYSSKWTLDTKNGNQLNDQEVSAKLNIPTITVTTANGQLYTAYFNCYTIRNARQAPNYTNPVTGTKGSKGYVYDNGATILLEISENQPIDYSYYFCLLTEEDIKKLEEWYTNPTADLTLGRSVTNQESYYIYNPFTRRYATGTSISSTGSVYYTTLTKPAEPFKLIYDTKNEVGVTGTGYKIVYNNFPGISWNAYGGIGSTYAIAGWTIDSGSLWVFDEVQEANQYVTQYQAQSETQSIIAYELSYTVNIVHSHILRNEISKQYEFDKFYFLNSDVTINGITYKAGNVVRYNYNAFYGFEYEADIEYYEIIFTYTDASGATYELKDIAALSYIYYTADESKEIHGFTGEISYEKCDPNGDFGDYNQSFTYTNGLETKTIKFDEIKWIYTAERFDEIKWNLYLDEDGKESAAESVFNEYTSYYMPDYKEATVFSDTFHSIKNSLYSDTNGTPVSEDAVYSPTTIYYTIGNVRLNTIDASNYIYYVNNIYLDASGTPVPLNAIYDSETTYYFINGYKQVDVTAENFDSLKNRLYLNEAGDSVPANAVFDSTATYYEAVYTTDLPKYYDVAKGDYVAITLNSDNFNMLKHTIYDADGNRFRTDSNFNSDITYYYDSYVESTFRQDVFNEYRSVLYLDINGTPIGVEDVFNSSITYYTNLFIVADDITNDNFDENKAILYLDINGTPLASDAVYNSDITYYKKKLSVAQPKPVGSDQKAWNEVDNKVDILYSHTKVAEDGTIDRYITDYSHIYTEGYPTVYKYTGTGSENIYATPTVTLGYEKVKAGYVSITNWNAVKNTLYIYSNGGYVPAAATDFSDLVTYYVEKWTTEPNIVTRNVSYTTNNAYTLQMGSSNIFNQSNTSVLYWTKYQDAPNTNSAQTMDEIIAEANTHFSDASYNTYYGMHYAYNGFTMASTSMIVDSDGNILNGYDKGYVYRIIEDTDNSKFIWQRVYTYKRATGSQMVIDASTGESTVGDVIFATEACFGSFYTGGKFYRVVYDDFTQTQNIIQFTDVKLTNNDGYTDIQSQKIHYIYQSDYLGYAGTFEISISAVIRDPNEDENYSDNQVKTYKIKFVGTVIR